MLPYFTNSIGTLQTKTYLNSVSVYILIEIHEKRSKQWESHINNKRPQ